MPEEMMSEGPLAAIGEEDVVLGFKALGFKVCAATQPQEAQAAIEDIISAKVAVCLVQEEIYESSKDKFALYKKLPMPVFIPFSRKGKSAALDGVAKDIKVRATGTF